MQAIIYTFEDQDKQFMNFALIKKSCILLFYNWR